MSTSHLPSRDAPKHVLLSGGAQGIGRCIARTALEKGHKVFILDINKDELKYTVESHLKTHASSVSYAVVDLRDPKALRSAAKKAADFLDNRVDILVHNGGIAAPKWKDGATMADEETLDQWQAYIETNLTAPFVLTQACIPYMKISEDGEAHHETQTQGGAAGPCVVLIGSFRAHQSDPDQEGYAATKSGLLGLMHSMAISLSRWGIRVNLVAPGRIKVAHESKEADEKGTEWGDLHEEKDVEDHSTNRAGMPQDISDAVWYLAGAGFVNGQDVTVDGGATKQK